MSKDKVSYVVAIAAIVGTAASFLPSHDKLRADMTIDEKTRQIAQREIDADPGRFSDARVVEDAAKARTV